MKMPTQKTAADISTQNSRLMPSPTPKHPLGMPCIADAPHNRRISPSISPFPAPRTGSYRLRRHFPRRRDVGTRTKRPYQTRFVVEKARTHFPVTRGYKPHHTALLSCVPAKSLGHPPRDTLGIQSRNANDDELPPAGRCSS